MQGSKRSARSWHRGRGADSLRGEIKYSLRKNKKCLNRKVRNYSDLPSGSAYKKIAKDKRMNMSHRMKHLSI